MTTQGTRPDTDAKVVGFTGAAVVQELPSSPAEICPPHVRGNQQPPRDGISDKDLSKMQVCWDTAMCEAMKVPAGYLSVAVLIIMWSPALDKMQGAGESEVKELEELFQQSFHFPTRVARLHHGSKPQLQLNAAIMSFANDYNGPHNLLIIYYTGHGLYDPVNCQFELHACDERGDIPKGNYPAQANWNRAEVPLMDEAECDVLAIFDACYASNIQKNTLQNRPRIYELLAASGHDKTTAGPGPRSFTTALIDSLKTLLKECGDKPITVRQLCEKINLQETRRKNQSHVWSRFNCYERYIALAPLKPTSAERDKEFESLRTRAFLSLRLSLTRMCLTDEEISSIAQGFSKAAKDSKVVKQIEWAGLHVVKQTRWAGLGLALHFFLRWKRKTFNKTPRQSPVAAGDESLRPADDPRGRISSQGDTPDPITAGPSSDMPASSGHGRKRELGQGYDNTSSLEPGEAAESNKQRRESVSNHSPLTPTSDSERQTT